ncbi:MULTISPECIES: hypothetical protein [unclassified Rhodococcus (in: high G+C Gram-positive bacteria)]|uniref:hypothetical protein n=1 Tax=unclassified Rhodococcus (in: high G+C Gram-positive bacteria) TaxID=192944 RepID=UPI000368163E|nr:hypothetical protein [Rhodococcus sp. DK17]
MSAHTAVHDFHRRPRKAPAYRGEGHALQLSGTALVLVGVVSSLASLVIFGFASPLSYVSLSIAAVLCAIGVRRNYLGVAFTEIEWRLGLPEAEK